jgi:UDP-2-acetamido-3-amino-2,3-dideoxy-glucuronate N-acetyltransferase
MNIYENPYEYALEAPISPDTKFGNNVRIGDGVVIDAGCTIGDNCFIGHNTVIRKGVTIGNNTVIGHLCVVESDTTIGDRVLIHCQCHITKDVVIEDDVFMGVLVGMTNTNRIVHGRNIDLKIEGPKIKRAARIGSGVMLMPGVVVGENAQVGLGSIVTKNIPDREVWFGTPAVFKRCVDEKELL